MKSCFMAYIGKLSASHADHEEEVVEAIGGILEIDEWEPQHYDFHTGRTSLPTTARRRVSCERDSHHGCSEMETHERIPCCPHHARSSVH